MPLDKNNMRAWDHRKSKFNVILFFQCDSSVMMHCLYFVQIIQLTFLDIVFILF